MGSGFHNVFLSPEDFTWISPQVNKLENLKMQEKITKI